MVQKFNAEKPYILCGDRFQCMRSITISRYLRILMADIFCSLVQTALRTTLVPMVRHSRCVTSMMSRDSEIIRLTVL